MLLPRSFVSFPTQVHRKKSRFPHTTLGQRKDQPMGRNSKLEVDGTCELGLGSCFNGRMWIHTSLDVVFPPWWG